jgi:O-antigen ligase
MKNESINMTERDSMLKIAMYLAILAMPLYGVRIPILSTSASILDFFMLAVIVVGIASLKLYKKENLVQYVRSRPKYFFYGVSLLFVGLIIGILIHPPYGEKIGIFFEWFLLPVLTACIVSIAIFHNKVRSESILSVYCISAGLVSITALGYLISGNMTYDGRLNAFYLSPNHLAMYVVPAISALWLWPKSEIRNPKSEMIRKGFLLCMSIVLYFTYSYGAWIAVIVSIGVGKLLFMLYNCRCEESSTKQSLSFKKRIATPSKTQVRNDIKKRSAVLILFLGITVSVIVAFQWNSTKLQDLVQLDERSSLASRVMIWKSAAHILQDNWLWGIGPGTFQGMYLEYQKFYPPYLEWAVPQPHNLYLAFWLQTGVLGFFGFMLTILSWALWQMKRMASNQDPDTKKLRIILLVMILSILLHGLIDTPYWKNDLSLLFFLLILI